MFFALTALLLFRLIEIKVVCGTVLRSDSIYCVIPFCFFNSSILSITASRNNIFNNLYNFRQNQTILLYIAACHCAYFMLYCDYSSSKLSLLNKGESKKSFNEIPYPSQKRYIVFTSIDLLLPCFIELKVVCGMMLSLENLYCFHPL